MKNKNLRLIYNMVSTTGKCFLHRLFKFILIYNDTLYDDVTYIYACRFYH